MSVLVGKDVTLDDGEHAGGEVGYDDTVVAPAEQGDPAHFVQGEDAACYFFGAGA
ncbi:hypothetical protein [Rhodococcus opacus]|uniref:hypothetical protein n=1 Tax=Rhodococcus opacus TaxID=37919 RepID=UPI0016510F17|nr:hypothetical protein [Rhodococcus opacus]UDH01399.1 hypothetical protein K2Z90_007913 [Rhodococcus opacus PD630]